jgi:hypothetical protein
MSSLARTAGGLFSFEITDFALEELELEAKLLDIMMGETYFFYLSRRNFVAQPVPRYTAVEIGGSRIPAARCGRLRSRSCRYRKRLTPLLALAPGLWMIRG